MCGMCCTKTKEIKNNDHEGKRQELKEEAVWPAPSVDGPVDQSFEENPMNEKKLGSWKEEDHQMKKQKQNGMMDSEPKEGNKTHLIDDEGMKKNKPIRWLSGSTDFPSANPKVKDDNGLPNMNDSKIQEEKPSSEDNEIVDDREFPWMRPPAVEKEDEDDEEEEEMKKKYEDEREFPQYPPKVYDEGTTFPYHKPPKTVEKKGSKK